MRSLAVVLAPLATAACSQILGLHDLPPDARRSGDAAIDTSFDASTFCYGGGTFVVCLPAQPAGTLVLNTQSYDTTTCPGGTAVLEAGGVLCVLAGQSVIIDGTVRAVGARPLVIVSLSTLALFNGANVDVSSGVTTGAGADFGACPITSLNGTSGTLGGGGAGGSFGTAGGRGGDATGSPGGSAAPATGTPTELRAGCGGGAGGTGQLMTNGAGGNGGGAVYLLAEGALQLDGTIDASGAGGTPASISNMPGGAGGGGSGGMIALYGASISLAAGAQIFANGGGGAGFTTTNAIGAAGGVSTSATNTGPGGSPGGGPGAIASQNGVNGSNGSSGAGGAGGGGGVGVIHVVSGQPLNGSVSPPPS